MYDITRFKEVLDPLLAEQFDACVARFAACSQDSVLLSYLAHTRTILLQGGKRIRPYMVYLGYCSLKEPQDDALEIPPSLLRACASLELFHTFALIHDDIIDAGLVRHGVPSLHQYIETEGAASLPADRLRRIAEGQALLIGDLLFSWSREMLAEAVNDVLLRSCMRIFDTMAETVVTGQMLDVETMRGNPVSEAQILQKTLLKTSYYTFVYPLQLGFCLSENSTEENAQLAAEIGEALGMAFQIQDDVMDIESTTASLGKRTMNDVREGQHTVLTSYVQKHGTKEDTALLDQVFGCAEDTQENTARITDDEVRAMFIRSGAVAAARTQVTNAFTQAESLIAETSFPEPVSALWHALIQRMRQRTS